jgi:hypothetical protein
VLKGRAQRPEIGPGAAAAVAGDHLAVLEVDKGLARHLGPAPGEPRPGQPRGPEGHRLAFQCDLEGGEQLERPGARSPPIEDELAFEERPVRGEVERGEVVDSH